MPASVNRECPQKDRMHTAADSMLSGALAPTPPGKVDPCMAAKTSACGSENVMMPYAKTHSSPASHTITTQIGHSSC